MAEELESCGLKPDRLAALADGVIAIVVTVLVLSLDEPPDALAAGGLWDDLAERWHQIVGYAGTFLLIGFYWWFHHVIFHYVERTDRIFVWLNLLFLMLVAWLPYPTGFLLNHPTDPLIIGFCAAAHLGTSLLLAAIWWSAVKDRRLVSSHIDPAVCRDFARRLMIAPVIFLAAIGAAFVQPIAAVLLVFLVPAISLLPSAIHSHWHSLQRQG